MPHLLVAEKGGAKSYRVDPPETVVGRDPACDLVLEGDAARTVSGRHARFFLEQGRWYVEDLGSRNGTFLGSRRLGTTDRHELAPGDIVGLGLTGTQLLVQEVVGRGYAETIVEAAPAPPPPPRRISGGTVPMRRSEAIHAGIHDLGQGEQVRIVMRATDSGEKLVGQADRVTIGRALECLIRVEGGGATSVSRVHAEVSAQAGQAVIRDGGSRHGTFVNGTKIDEMTILKPGDLLVLGPGGPSFTIEEARLCEESDAIAPSSGENPDGVFRAELPTPPIARPAAIPSRKARPTDATPTVSDDGGRRALLWGGLAVIALALVLAVLFIRRGS